MLKKGFTYSQLQNLTFDCPINFAANIPHEKPIKVAFQLENLVGWPLIENAIY